MNPIKHTAEILAIEWLDEEAREGDVLFRINGNEYRAFSHPTRLMAGETTAVVFDILVLNGADTSFWDGNKEHKKAIIQLSGNTWSYGCYGVVESVHPVIVDCGDIKLDTGDWINDESVAGSYVYFLVDRLDINKSM